MEGVLLVLDWVFKGLAALGPIGEAMATAFRGGQTQETAMEAMRMARADFESSPDPVTRGQAALDARIAALPADEDEEPDSIETDDDP